MLINRFQKVLHLCINEAQSTFVPGFLISDNIIVAYEILHSMRNRSSGGLGSFVLKLDMSKAYDRVEWESILLMLRRMGFGESSTEKI